MPNLYLEKVKASVPHKMFFVLLATQSDPTLLYNESLSNEESEDRSRENLCGLTIVCVKRHRSERVTYRGLCMRAAWTRLERDTFDELKAWLIFRDKCCNQRNFNNLIQMVNTTKRVHNGRRERTLPHCCQLLQTYYQHVRVPEYLLPAVSPTAEENGGRPGIVALPLRPNRYLNGLAGPPSNERYAEFYQQMLTFIREEVRVEQKQNPQLSVEQIPIFHKLPIWMSSWLCKDLLALEPSLRFEYMGASISAKNVYTSPHCRFRVNHNASICEICLMDEYGAQLCDRMPTSSFSAQTKDVNNVE